MATLDETVRAAVEADIRAGDLSRNAIARKHGVAHGTVTNIARAAGITGAFDRSATAAATVAHTFDAKAARAQMMVDLYGDAQKLRARAWAAYTQPISGPNGPELVTTKLPPARDQQAMYTSLAIALDKAIKLEGVDAGDAAAPARSMLGALAAGLNAAYEQIQQAEASEGAQP